MIKTVKFKKLVQVLFIIAIIVSLSINSIALATQTTPEQDVKDAYDNLSGTSTGGDDEEVYKTLREVANMLVGAAMCISAIKMAQIGYKFMFGVANKKSDALQSLLPWGIGVFICALWLVLGNWIMEMITGGGSAPTGPFDV